MKFICLVLLILQFIDVESAAVLFMILSLLLHNLSLCP